MVANLYMFVWTTLGVHMHVFIFVDFQLWADVGNNGFCYIAFMQNVWLFQTLIWLTDKIFHISLHQLTDMYNIVFFWHDKHDPQLPWLWYYHITSSWISIGLPDFPDYSTLSINDNIQYVYYIIVNRIDVLFQKQKISTLSNERKRQNE